MFFYCNNKGLITKRQARHGIALWYYQLKRFFLFGCSSSKKFFFLVVLIVHNVKNICILQKHSWLLSWVELWKVFWLWGWSENGVPSSVLCDLHFWQISMFTSEREVFICCFLPCLKDTVTKAWHDDDKLGNILHPVVGSLYLKMCRSRVYVYMAYLISLSCFVFLLSWKTSFFYLIIILCVFLYMYLHLEIRKHNGKINVIITKLFSNGTAYLCICGVSLMVVPLFRTKIIRKGKSRFSSTRKKMLTWLTIDWIDLTLCNTLITHLILFLV